MPRQAKTADGRIVSPSQVTEEMDLYCLDCNGPMYYRNPVDKDHHFCHKETDDHFVLRQEYYCAMMREFDSELKMDDPEIDSKQPAIGDRNPDILVEFSAPRPVLGKGLAIECVATHQKDGEKTTEYLNNGYTAVWLKWDDGIVTDEVRYPDPTTSPSLPLN